MSQIVAAPALANCDMLIADESNKGVIEVNRNHAIVWHLGGPNRNKRNGVAFASRLPDRNALITDSNSNRIPEATPAGEIVREYVTNTRQGSVRNPSPSRAVRLANRNTLVGAQFNDQVIEIDMSGNIVFAQGQIGVARNRFDELNAPL